jgi:hypothetical protein
MYFLGCVFFLKKKNMPKGVPLYFIVGEWGVFFALSTGVIIL